MRMRFPRFLFAKSGIVIIFSFVPVMTVRTRARGVKPEIPEFFDLSFEELSNIQVHVPAVLTKLSPEEIPASITVIIAGDIRLTPGHPYHFLDRKRYYQGKRILR